MMEDDYMPSYIINPSNLQLKESFRKEGIHFDPDQAYAGKNNLFSIKLHHGGKFTPPPKRMYVGGKVNYVDKIDADLFNSTVEIEELDDDVLNAPLVGNSKMLALCWINEADVAETSVEKNANVNVVGESCVNVVGESSMGKNDNVPADLNVEDYTVYVDQDKNKNENVNVVENVDKNVDENMNENVNADDEYNSDENEQDNIKDEEGKVNTLSVGQEFANKELAKARIKAHAVKTKRKIGIVKNDNERLQAKCKGSVPRETSNVVESGPQGNILHACEAVDKETRNSESQGKNKMKGKSVNLVDED
nr:transposase, MuDR [Tanacetum cinerariifolium]